ncbi:hypothetical protein PO909_018264 [Leuciscus waleckii]
MAVSLVHFTAFFQGEDKIVEVGENHGCRPSINHQGKFLNIFVGYPGPVDDARAFGMLKTRWRFIFFKARESALPLCQRLLYAAQCSTTNLPNGDIVDAEVAEDHDIVPSEPGNTEASAGEDVRDNLAAALSTPDNCFPAQQLTAAGYSLR